MLPGPSTPVAAPAAAAAVPEGAVCAPSKVGRLLTLLFLAAAELPAGGTRVQSSGWRTP